MLRDSLDAILGLSTYLFGIFVLLLPILLIVFAWRFAALLATHYGDRFYEHTRRRRRFKKLGGEEDYAELLHKIRTLHPREFEYYVADILSKNGYKTEVTSKHGKPDGGVDIVARLDGTHYLVQCKKFLDSDVGVRHIREFYGIGADLKHTKNVKMIFVSTTYFTKAARDFAKKKGIKLIDADHLVELVFAQEGRGKEIGFNGFERSEVMRHVPPACPVCTRQLVWRSGPHGDFVGCKGYPECKYVFNSLKVNESDLVAAKTPV